MEELLAYLCLYREGLLSGERCRAKLDELFLADPENELLLELEWGFRDIREMLCRAWSYWGAGAGDFSGDAFGRVLMAQLRELYRQEGNDIRRFAGRMYCLWESLPPWLQDRQPFWALCYGDDPLSWGDEAQTREICEAMLAFYDGEAGEGQRSGSGS